MGERCRCSCPPPPSGCRQSGCRPEWPAEGSGPARLSTDPRHSCTGPRQCRGTALPNFDESRHVQLHRHVAARGNAGDVVVPQDRCSTTEGAEFGRGRHVGLRQTAPTGCCRLQMIVRMAFSLPMNLRCRADRLARRAMSGPPAWAPRPERGRLDKSALVPHRHLHSSALISRTSSGIAQATRDRPWILK